MNLLKIIVVLFFGAFIFFPQYRAQAGGGRIVIATVDPDGTHVVNNGIEVRAFMGKPDDGGSPSINEYAEFRIVNQRAEDRCDTSNGKRSDSNGYLNGNCVTSIPGNMLIYVHSFDYNDQSSQSLLIFLVPTPTSTLTPTPTTAKTPTPTKKPTATPSKKLAKTPTPTINVSTTITPTNTSTPSPTRVPVAMIQSTNNSLPPPSSPSSAPKTPLYIPVAIILGVLIGVSASILVYYKKFYRSNMTFETGPLADPSNLNNFTPLQS